MDDRLRDLDAHVLKVILGFKPRVSYVRWCPQSVIMKRLAKKERTIRLSYRRLARTGFIRLVPVPVPDPDDPRNKTGYRIVLLFDENCPAELKASPDLDRRPPRERKVWTRVVSGNSAPVASPPETLFEPEAGLLTAQPVASEMAHPVASKLTGARGSKDGLELDSETPTSSSSLRALEVPGPDDDEVARSAVGDVRTAEVMTIAKAIPDQAPAPPPPAVPAEAPPPPPAELPELDQVPAPDPELPAAPPRGELAIPEPVARLAAKLSPVPGEWPLAARLAVAVAREFLDSHSPGTSGAIEDSLQRTKERMGARSDWAIILLAATCLAVVLKRWKAPFGWIMKTGVQDWAKYAAIDPEGIKAIGTVCCLMTGNARARAQLEAAQNPRSGPVLELERDLSLDALRPPPHEPEPRLTDDEYAYWSQLSAGNDRLAKCQADQKLYIDQRNWGPRRRE